jgi:hypothetical protein
MTSTELATLCGVSQRQIYNLKTKFPKEFPASFEDAEGWKRFVEAHRVVAATKRHAARSDAGTQSSNARYVAARARRTESLAAAEAIRLAITKRSVIDRAEVEREFARLGRLIRAQMMKLLADLPCSLYGQDAPDIEPILRDRFTAAMNNFVLPEGFLEPQKVRV